MTHMISIMSFEDMEICSLIKEEIKIFTITEPNHGVS